MNIASTGNSPSVGLVKNLRSALAGLVVANVLILAGLPAASAQQATDFLRGKVRFEISLPASIKETSLTGRIFLCIARTNQTEPRFESKASLFGQDIHAAAPGQRIVLDEHVAGCPEHTLADLPPGDYFVQAIFNVYTGFHRADGHTIWAHMDQWEGQNFATSPGNFFSEPQSLHVAAGAPAELKIRIDNIIPPIKVPADTEWVQRIKFPSPMLTRFWGRPIYLGATVLLPKGYATHPDERYPVIYIQGHFSLGAPFGFSPPPGPVAGGPPPDTKPGNKFYEAWTADSCPRMIAVTFQHPTPYFDDSYGVNSPNCGPYGDAILQELIPALERRFRMIQKPYARVLTGSSTGGWGSLAMQLYHPDFFGGTWAFSPDPVDFRLYYGGVNIYEDDNAYVEKPGKEFQGGGLRNRRGSQRVAVLGMQDGCWEWWKHTPTGPDGHPLNVWDLMTGRIDHAVAQQMRKNNFDLREYLARNWPRLGPRLIGKLHVCAADTDAFYSNLAVHLLEEFMRTTKDPHDAGTFHYGPPGSHHGWQPTSNAELIKEMAQYIADHQPGAR